MENNLYTCPCCGYLSLREEPGSDEICQVCLWHDDLPGLRLPTEAIGPNKVSLHEAQLNFERFGAKEKRLAEFAQVSRGRVSFSKDTLWRKIDPSIDKFDRTSNYPDDVRELYYWRPDYWLR